MLCFLYIINIITVKMQEIKNEVIEFKFESFFPEKNYDVKLFAFLA